VPPPGPTAAVRRGDELAAREGAVVLSGAVMVTERTSSMVAGNWPETEPSLKTVSERTTPLVWSTMRILEPDGKEPGGAETWTLPF